MLTRRPFTSRRLFYVAATFAVVLSFPLLSGCAKYPPQSPVAGQGKLIRVTMTVRGQIQPFDALTPYYYFILINRTDDPGDAGPVPIVQGPPWSNGFAAPAQQPPDSQGFVGFVRYDRFQGQTGYGVYTLADPVTGALHKPIEPQNPFFPLGPPDTYVTPQRGERTLTFQLNLNRLPRPEARFLQINFVATNNIPQGVDETSPKSWDALGDGTQTETINAWVRIDTTQNVTVRDIDRPFPDQEPENDVREKLGPVVDEPNLDIVDWSVEVRSQP